MSITTVFEVFEILTEYYQYLTILQAFEINAKHNDISDISKKL